MVLQAVKAWGKGVMRIAAGAGLGSLYGAYYLQGEFRRCQLLVQSRMDAVAKFLDH